MTARTLHGSARRFGSAGFGRQDALTDRAKRGLPRGFRRRNTRCARDHYVQESASAEALPVTQSGDCGAGAPIRSRAVQSVRPRVEPESAYVSRRTWWDPQATPAGTGGDGAEHLAAVSEVPPTVVPRTPRGGGT